MEQIEKVRLWKALARWRQILREKYGLVYEDRMDILSRHEKVIRS